MLLSDTIKQKLIIILIAILVLAGFGFNEEVNSATYYYIQSKLSTTANSVANWGEAETLSSETNENANVYGSVVPLTSGDMYATYVVNTTIYGIKYTSGSGWGTATEITTSAKTGLANNLSVVSDSNGYIHMTYIGSFICGDSVTFTYKGSSVTYGTVSHNGECWMDRNLGASQVATAYNDSNAYGDLFQWGRLDDLHQNRNSGTTKTLSATDVPGHSNFIYGMSSPPYDWRSGQNNNLWQGVSGTNNPCPTGWRIPTKTEWDTEFASWSEQNYNGAYASPLKLTAGGYRDYVLPSLEGVDTSGRYYSSTIYEVNAYHLYFDASTALTGYNYRANGRSVRCILDDAFSNVENVKYQEYAQSSWFGLSYRKEISISKQPSAGTNYQVKLLIGKTSGADGEDFDLNNHCQDDFDDIRFTDNNGVTPLDYWVESVASSGTSYLATVWVEVADDLTGTSGTVPIYIYYGDSSASSASSGDDTFLIFDDFDGSSLDTGKWEQYSTLNLPDSFSDSKAHFDYNEGIQSKTAYDFAQPVSVMFYADINTFSSEPTVRAQLSSRIIDRNSIVTEVGANWYAEGSYDRYIYGVTSDWWNGTGTGAQLGECRHEFIAIPPSSFRWICSGVVNFDNTREETDNYPSCSTRYVAWYTPNYAYLQVDLWWIAVRKYASTEPAYNSAGSETLAWHTAVTLDSTATNEYCTLAIDTAGNNGLYAFWIRDNNIYYRRGCEPYESANWDSAVTFESAGGNSNDWSVAGYEDFGSGKIFAEWTQGAASPFSVKWKSLTPTACTPPTITVSGYMYENFTPTKWDECDGLTENVKISVESGTTYTTTCSAVDGSFSKADIPKPTTDKLISVYMEGETEDGVSVTLYDTNQSTVSLNVYKDTLRIESLTSTSMTNAKLATWDSGEDTDILYTVDVSNNLSTASTVKTYINTGDTYAPGANVSTGYLEIVGTYTGASETLTLSGSGTGASRPLYINSGTFTADSNTTVFTGSAESDIQETTYNNLELKPSANATYHLATTGSQTITINGNLTVGNETNTPTIDWTTYDPAITLKGSLDLNSPSVWTKSDTATLTWTVSGTKTWADDNGTKQDIGIVSITGGSSTPIIQLSTGVKASTLAVASAQELALNSQDLTITNGALTTADTGTITCSGCSAGTATILGTGNLGGGTGAITFYNLTLGDTTEAGTTTAASDFTVSHVFTIEGEIACNSLSGWHWFTTNGRSACWSKTLADLVSWNKGVGDDTDNPGAFTCATGYTLGQRMAAAAAGEWYKIVSSVNSRDITSSDNGSAGYAYISALAIADCVDGTRDLCTGDGCTGATDWSSCCSYYRTWAGASGKSALPYLSTNAGATQATNDYWDACDQSGTEDQTLGCSSGNNYFYLNRKACNDDDTNYSWVAACGNGSGNNWDDGARVLGYDSCSNQGTSFTSSPYGAYSFRVVVRLNNNTFDASNKTITLAGSTTPFMVNGTFTPSTSTIKYTGTSATNITSTTYYNLEFSPASGTPNYTIAGNITANNNVTIGDGTNAVTLKADTNNPVLAFGNSTLDSTSTFLIKNTASFVGGTSNLTVYGDLTIESGADYTKGSGTLIFDGGDDTYPRYFTDSNGTKENMGTVQIGNSPAVTKLKSAMTADSLTVASGDTLYTQGWDLNIATFVTVNGTLDCTDSGGANNEGNGTIINLGTDWTVAGGATFTSQESETYPTTVVFDETGASALSPGGTDENHDFYNLQVAKSSANTVTLSGAIDVENDLTIANSNSTLDVSATDYAINVGGSWSNSGTFTAQEGTVTFDSGDTGETIVTGGTGAGQTFYNIVFNNSGGGWTISTNDLKATNNFTLTSLSSFDATNRTITVQGQFKNNVGGAGTTWTGSTLVLDGTGSYCINDTKNVGGDVYSIFNVSAGQYIRMWDSSASTYNISGSLYSMDHGANDGYLSIWGAYTVPDSATDYWSYSNDFDSAGVSRQCQVTIQSGASITVGSGENLEIKGGESASGDKTTITYAPASGSWNFNNDTGSELIMQEAKIDYMKVNTGTVTALNTVLDSTGEPVAPTAGATLNSDWYVGVHLVDAGSLANIDTGDTDVVISENSGTPQATVWKYDTGSWGSAAAYKETGTGSDGKIPQPGTNGAIRIREYSRTSSGYTFYYYNVHVKWQTSYGEYDYYEWAGDNKYVISSYYTGGGHDNVIGDSGSYDWHREDIDANNTEPTIDQPPTYGTFYLGLRPGLDFEIVDSDTDTPPTVELGTLASPNLTSTDWLDLKVTTSASHGYIVTAWASSAYTPNVFRHNDFPDTIYIDDFSGNYSSPAEWSGYCKDNASYCGFGYTSNDPLVEGSNRYSSASKYAKFASTSPGNIISDYSQPVSKADTGGTYRMTVKTSVPVTQLAGDYSTTLIFICTANY